MRRIWYIAEPTVREIELDFSSSGQQPHLARQIVAGDVVLANMADLTDWTEDPSQVLVCTSCGIVRCAAGGWAAIRFAGALVVWLPAFAKKREDEVENMEPPYMPLRGLPAFDGDVYAQLANRAGLPGLDQLRWLSGAELADLAEWLGEDAEMTRPLAAEELVVLAPTSVETNGVALPGHVDAFARPAIELDGGRIVDRTTLVAELNGRLQLDAKWNGHLDAFNDILRGGFGTPPHGFILRWHDSDASRAALGEKLFGTIVEIIRNHGPAGDEAGSGITLLLE